LRAGSLLALPRFFSKEHFGESRGPLPLHGFFFLSFARGPFWLTIFGCLTVCLSSTRVSYVPVRARNHKFEILEGLSVAEDLLGNPLM
jgi:hypothetical protein